MMFPRRRVQPNRPKQDEGCKMDIKRDGQGRIKSLKTNGKCKSEIDMLRESGELPTNQEKTSE